jgi:L-ascorbate metabolism protein UlaG (beta-lactamase superfamily)
MRSRGQMKLLLFFFCLSFAFSCSAPSIERTNIKAPYDGKKFDNLEPFPEKSFFTLLKWRWTSRNLVEKWPDYQNRPQFKPVERSKELLVTVINHATVLIQVDNVNILTDPHYSQRTSPVSWAGPKRVIPPSIKFEDLPSIDAVLVSHNHYDHLDLKTLKDLSERFHCPIFAGLGTAHFLEEEGISGAVDVDWWDKTILKGVDISFVPAQHWSARGLFDKREMLWGGFYIKSENRSVYFAGDTGYGKFFTTIRQRLGPPDLALLPIGAYRPRWFMKNAHMNPADAVQAYLDLKAKKAVGIHFGTFQLTDEGIERPSEDLAIAKDKASLSYESFVVPIFGKAIRPFTLK